MIQTTLKPRLQRNYFAADEWEALTVLKEKEGEFVKRKILLRAIDDGHITACISRLNKKLRKMGQRVIHNSEYFRDPSLKRNRKKSAWGLNVPRDVGLPPRVRIDVR